MEYEYTLSDKGEHSSKTVSHKRS